MAQILAPQRRAGASDNIDDWMAARWVDIEGKPDSFPDRVRYGTAPATHAVVGSGLTIGTTDDLAGGGAHR